MSQKEIERERARKRQSQRDQERAKENQRELEKAIGIQSREWSYLDNLITNRQTDNWTYRTIPQVAIATEKVYLVAVQVRQESIHIIN